ncbi:hypothetical protein [Dongia sp.]|uniref:hypothetical protein n=1 Tax=Dongia sp. TaxID=1977262 RepID=UPI0035B267A3
MSNPLAAKALMALGAGCSHGLTRRAYEMWQRQLRDPRLTRLVTGAYFGIDEMGDIPSLEKGGPLTAWPGWQAFPGVARARFDGKGGWDEHPLGEIGYGRLVVTLPVGVWEPVWQYHTPDVPGVYRLGEQYPVDQHRAPANESPPVRLTGWRFLVTDIIACDPVQPSLYGRLTRHADLLGEDLLNELHAGDGLQPDLRQLRLHRYPLDWWRAGNGWAVVGTSCCILEPRAWREERVLERPWICDDELHAADVAARQSRARAALTANLIPQVGALAFVAQGFKGGGMGNAGRGA